MTEIMKCQHSPMMDPKNGICARPADHKGLHSDGENKWENDPHG